ncbi:hemerythrin domain-containing protein [Mycobacterium sp. 852002-10029_SCH5224772]|uniref:hemerythrin domain-containing protein n=1 Tax=Mycobacterium sp. 852002-10029_SCH5224772 TaxID=1834083 RepID=UPI0007FDF829|nr:hemerythrin domain-containing protein [Mycobacterium sp. 852002-10029_SCH5224772]OBF11246.1 hemerythrin [Mycobacterium sp. 852002-10029_SCH5224772]
MSDRVLSAELMRQHREIGAAIGCFIEKLDGGDRQPELLRATMDALRRHIYLEEIFLFPPIRKAGIMMPVFVKMREHGQLWRTMETLTRLLADRTGGPRLENTCNHLLSQLHEHDFSEEPVVYLHADYDLPAPTSAQLTRFVVTGRIPDGWVCQQAGTKRAR